MATHRRRMSKLSLEPNPFEQSFSLVRSKGVPVPVDVENTLVVHGPLRSGLSSRPHRTPSPGELMRAGSEADGDSSRTETARDERRYPQQQQQSDGQQTRPSSTPAEGRAETSVKLPPITAIDVPMSGVATAGGWGAESLRSGPLSPAMLGGPAGPTAKPAGRPTPRLGVSDPLLHTGLTPFIAGETHPTTAAIEGTRPAPALATPGLQAVIRAAFDGKEITATPGGTLHIADPQHPPPRAYEAALAGVAASMPLSHDVAAALSTMADTRLLPAAAGEGTLGAAQPMASLPYVGPTDNLPIVTGAMSLVTRPLPAPELPASSPPAAAPPGHRAKRRKNATAPALAQSSSPQSQLPHQSQSTPPGPPARAKRVRSTKPSRGRAPAKAATTAAQKTATQSVASSDADDGDSDDKRRQFLERNRIAALKCRQRKKRQLQELQERHDYMMTENERLHSEFAQMRETALRVRTLLAAHSECSVARANGVLGAENLPIGTPSVSMRPLMFPAANTSESEHARQIIAAIPPSSNGIPIHDVNIAVASAEQQHHSFGPTSVHSSVLAPSVVSQNQNIQFASVPIVPSAAPTAASNPHILHPNPQPL
ncbi:Transcription factor [Coemansia sp. RSA 988]|nr:Transcription factor [Coemansia sp. RSA 988]